MAQVLEAVTIKIRDLLAADRATVFLIDDTHTTVWSKVAHHPGKAHLDIRIPLMRSIAGHVARTGETVNIVDAHADPPFDPTTDRETGYRTTSVLCMPIRDGRQRIFAVVPLLNKRGCEGFTAADERAFSEFARPLAVILETSSRVAWSPTPGRLNRDLGVRHLHDRDVARYGQPSP